jgi:predicted PhzF superfamily epimerase YddE/YHI9
MGTEVLRYSAFTTAPEGGNPAGVVLDATGLDDTAMLKTAAGVGYTQAGEIPVTTALTDDGVTVASPT